MVRPPVVLRDDIVSVSKALLELTLIEPGSEDENSRAQDPIVKES